jgi:hypothetical protein
VAVTRLLAEIREQGYTTSPPAQVALPNLYGPTSICPLPYDNAPRGDVIGPHKTGLAERHEP